MRAVEAALIVAALGAIVYFTVRAALDARRRPVWRAELKPRGETCVVMLVKGRDEAVFKTLPAGAPEEEIEEALVDARVRCDTLNASLPRRKG